MLLGTKWQGPRQDTKGLSLPFIPIGGSNWHNLQQHDTQDPLWLADLLYVHKVQQQKRNKMTFLELHTCNYKY